MMMTANNCSALQFALALHRLPSHHHPGADSLCGLLRLALTDGQRPFCVRRPRHQTRRRQHGHHHDRPARRGRLFHRQLWRRSAGSVRARCPRWLYRLRGGRDHFVVRGRVHQEAPGLIKPTPITTLQRCAKSPAGYTAGLFCFRPMSQAAVANLMRQMFGLQ